MNIVRATFTFDMGVRGQEVRHRDFLPADMHQGVRESVIESSIPMDGFLTFQDEQSHSLELYPASRLIKVTIQEL